MSKRTKILFISIFSIFGAIAVFIITLSFFEPDDNYKMGFDTLINNFREDTQNYENVNREHLEKYIGKTFTISGLLYSYESKNKNWPLIQSEWSYMVNLISFLIKN